MMVEIAWSDIIDFYRHQQDLGVHNEQFSKKRVCLAYRLSLVSSMQMVDGALRIDQMIIQDWALNLWSLSPFSRPRDFQCLQRTGLVIPISLNKVSGNWYSFKIKNLLLLEPKYHLAGWHCKNAWHGAWLVATKSNGWTLKNKYAIDKFQVWHKLLQPDSSAYKTTSLHSAQILTAWWFISHHSWFHSPKLEPPRVVKLQRCSGSLQGL